MTKRQNKIFMMAGIAALTFAVFVYFIYLPAKKNLDQLNREYTAMQNDIAAMKQAIGEGKPLEQAILYLRDRLKMYEQKFPQKEEDIFRTLSALAEKGSIDILAMTPEKKRPIKEITGVPINVKDHTLEEMPISLSVRAAYKKLGQFLNALQEEFPIFVRVDEVRMTKAPDGADDRLDASLNLDTYLLTPGLQQGQT